MLIVESAIQNPMKVLVGVTLLVLFGTISLFLIPVQLSPEIEHPAIRVSTTWPGASPQEIEREVVGKQEQVLRNIAGLERMESQSRFGSAWISLEFELDTDLNAAMLQVANGLDQVDNLPPTVRKPMIHFSNFWSPVAQFKLITQRGSDGDITRMMDFAEEVIQTRFERVAGVARCYVWGGRRHELQVRVDFHRLAAHGLGVSDLRRAIRRRNVDTSGGLIEQGRRQYLVRTAGRFQRPEDVENLILSWDNGPVYLKDVADVSLGYSRRDGIARSRGQRCLSFSISRKPQTNTLDVVQSLYVVQRELNKNVLAGRGLELVQDYDQTEYIRSAISLVRNNLLIGGLLAAAVLLVFLGSLRSVLVIVLAIPISIMGTFVMLMLLHRSLNVVSLAGLAFAVGMVVDSAIVVLENIHRHYQAGKPPREAAALGTSEVWGAVLASTLTTLAVFIPMLFIRDEVGRLFHDIAIAISCAVGLSLVISITVIPTCAAYFLRSRNGSATPGGATTRGTYLLQRVTSSLIGWVAFLHRGTFRRATFVVVMIGGSVSLIWWLIPPLDYFPSGNSNEVSISLTIPPSYNLDAMEVMLEKIERRLAPYWSGTIHEIESESRPTGATSQAMAQQPDQTQGPDQPQQPAASLAPGQVPGELNPPNPARPLLDAFATWAWKDLAGVQLYAADSALVDELMAQCKTATEGIPGVQEAAVSRPGVLQRYASQRAIDIEIRGPELDELITLGEHVADRVQQLPDGIEVVRRQGLQKEVPEQRLIPRWERAAGLGVSSEDLGYTVEALVDGAYAGDYFLNGRRIDLVIRARDDLFEQSAELQNKPIVTPSGRIVPLGSLAEVTLTTAPMQIQRTEGQRSVTVEVRPPEGMAIQTALEKIRRQIVQPMNREGLLQEGLYDVVLAGTVTKLERTWTVLRWNLLFAVVITYLLLVGLFESIVHPLVVMVSVPLAGVGGLAALKLVNLFVLQPLDMLTMLGFVILIGTVVNNAILLIHQALVLCRTRDLAPREAMLESIRNRVRPIFMSVSTTVLGMAPLALVPGAGSELYRGIGAVVIGGLLVSAVFTLVLVPILFDLATGGWLGSNAVSPQSAGRSLRSIPATPSQKHGVVP